MRIEAYTQVQQLYQSQKVNRSQKTSTVAQTDQLQISSFGKDIHVAKAALALGKKYGVELPIIEEVNAVLFHNKPVKEGVFDLMQREKRSEHSSLEWD